MLFRSKKKDEAIWHSEWGGQIVFSHGSEHSRGLCILAKLNGYPLEIIESDEEGQYILTDLKLTTEKLFVVNVYAPTFLQKLTYLLVSKTCISKVIMAGDRNTTLSHLDETGGLLWREITYRNGLLSLMKEFNLVEVCRRLHPNSKTYTYETKSKKTEVQNRFLYSYETINQSSKENRNTSFNHT